MYSMRNSLRILIISILFTACAIEQPVSRSSRKSFKQEFLELVNEVRINGCQCDNKRMAPVAPLTWNDLLEKAARGHAEEMARYRYMNHTNRQGQTSGQRIRQAGYTPNGWGYFATGENIAAGHTSIRQVFSDWMTSASHCQNIMNPKFREMGAAMENNYWVQDFGGRFTYEESAK